MESTSVFRTLVILMKAYVATLAGLGTMLSKRRKIMGLNKIGKSELRTLFGRFGVGVKEVSLKE